MTRVTEPSAQAGIDVKSVWESCGRASAKALNHFFESFSCAEIASVYEAPRRLQQGSPRNLAGGGCIVRARLV